MEFHASVGGMGDGGDGWKEGGLVRWDGVIGVDVVGFVSSCRGLEF